jgi:hypothetical protein
MYGLFMERRPVFELSLPGRAGLTFVSHVAATTYALQRRRASENVALRGTSCAIQLTVTVWCRAPLAIPNSENRLRFLIPSRAAHSIQKQIAALTNHKEYGFKHCSA